jgi:hypothetical protein
MAILVKAFPNQNVDSEIIFNYCSDLTDEQFSQAIDMIIMTETEINKATNMVALIRSKSKLKDYYPAEAAWANVLHVARYGGEFLNRATELAVSAVGWDNIRLKEDLSYERAFFVRAYNSAIEFTQKNENFKLIDNNMKKLVGGLCEKIGSGSEQEVVK